MTLVLHYLVPLSWDLNNNTYHTCYWEGFQSKFLTGWGKRSSGSHNLLFIQGICFHPIYRQRELLDFVSTTPWFGYLSTSHSNLYLLTSSNFIFEDLLVPSICGSLACLWRACLRDPTFDNKENICSWWYSVLMKTFPMPLPTHTRTTLHHI